MTSTAQGLGLVPQSVKPDPTNPRGPLVMPKSTADLPPPETDEQSGRAAARGFEQGQDRHHRH